MRLIDSDALCNLIEEGVWLQVYNAVGDAVGRQLLPREFKHVIEEQPTVPAIMLVEAHWDECYRDARCISVICSNCKQATAIAHGCFPDLSMINYESVLKRLPHCPHCCARMVLPTRPAIEQDRTEGSVSSVKWRGLK